MSSFRQADAHTTRSHAAQTGPLPASSAAVGPSSENALCRASLTMQAAHNGHAHDDSRAHRRSEPALERSAHYARLHGGRRPDGRAHSRQRLDGDAPRPRDRMAAEPPHRHQHLHQLAVPDGHLLGTRARDDLQRRLSSHSGRQAPSLARTTWAGVLGRGSRGRRIDASRRTDARRGHVVRRSLLATRPRGRPTGILLYVYV